eukprot:CAMPEP_0194054004 /NCGR_PEP_ID=MMETSP0009_2-20130614/52077_1 /TAXON_ID=210454 /ORGANISM="Grammatophora oceanica, Strain CCMP 410" /LENGTH=315 /DNA_ID=CAMNT_0038702345 /DNA_START=196 /DNA_END=1139 /DNA_ORIENTATION=+
MLAADKLQLQSSLKQQATALKEKEFNLHHSNFMTVGTQAAVLAGLDITMFIEFNPPNNETWGGRNDTLLSIQMIPRILKFLYYITIVTAFCANMVVVSHTTALSVLGAGLALRGPDGSMVTATDGLYEERRSVFTVFGIGLTSTVASVCLCVWLILQWEAALACMLATAYTLWMIHRNYKRVVSRFQYNEADTVDFSDIFDGPAAIQAVPKAFQRAWGGGGGRKHRNTKSTRKAEGPPSTPRSNNHRKGGRNGRYEYDDEDYDDDGRSPLMMNGGDSEHSSIRSLSPDNDGRPVQRSNGGSGGRFRRKANEGGGG